ncbi:RHS repeat-associated core domain-containing protein [Pseudoduganella sp. HUAS MS19]
MTPQEKINVANREYEQPAIPARTGKSRMLKWMIAGLFPALLGISAVGQLPALAAAPAASGVLALGYPSAPTTLRGQSATLLPDGRWLLLGGEGKNHKVKASATVIAADGKSQVLPVQSTTGRTSHSATLLPDGTVLIIGGADGAGEVISTLQRFDVVTGQFSAPKESALLPRRGHTATVLMDGRLLIAGGADARGNAVYEAEIYDPVTKTIERFNPKLDAPRLNHIATLLPSADVLLWQGLDAENQAREDGERYEFTSQRFSALSKAATADAIREAKAPEVAAIMATRPEANDPSAPVDQPVVIRFNQPMAVSSLNASTVTLMGPHGAVPVKIVPVEQGMLAFVKPTIDLLPDSRYNLFLDGVKSWTGKALAFSSFGFTTARLNGSGNNGEPHTPSDSGSVNHVLADTSSPSASSIAQEALQAVGAAPSLERQVLAALAKNTDSEFWLPDGRHFKGDWNAKRGASPLQRLPALKAPPGVTALAGQILTAHGRALRNARVQIGNQVALTDETGRFLLTNLTPGAQPLIINGGGEGKAQYGYYQVRVDVKAQQTNVLDYTIWSTRLDPAGNVALSSPTAGEVVLTSPRIPGLELRIPAGTIIRDHNGKIVTQLNMTAIPIDRPPFPLPNVGVPVYFTIQPGGATLTSASGQALQGARLIYPNFNGLAPGSRVDFWNYDARGKGWYVYGQGTISKDGKQAVPDAGVKIYEFTGAMISLPGNAPSDGPPPGGCGDNGTTGPSATCPANKPPAPKGCGGDPVDCSTGLFLNSGTDLVINDIMPIEISRTYRPRDAASRAFGIGTNLAYDIFLVGDTNPWTYQELILPDGGRIRYNRVSSGTGFGDAVYEHKSSATSYYGSTLRRGSTNACYWDLALMNGSHICFPESMNSGSARHAAAVSMSDRYGNALVFTRTNDNLTRVTSPSGRTVDLQYDAANRITQATDNIGRTVKYEYDAQGRLVKVTDPLGNFEAFTYDAMDRMLTVQDKRGNMMVTNEYDGNGRVAKQTYADGTTNLFAYTVDANNRVTQTDITNERGVVKRMVFGSAGYITSITEALGLPEQQITTYEYTPTTNLLLSVTDPLGRKTAYEYDAKGNMSRKTLLAGTANAVSTEITYTADYDNVQTIKDLAGRVTTRSYDGAGNLVRVADAIGVLFKGSYNGSGQLVASEDALGNLTTYHYDGFDLVQVTDPLGHSSRRVTDAVGRVTATLTPSGIRTSVDLDVLDRPVTSRDGLGNATTLGYDGNSNRTLVRNAKGGEHSFGFDKRNATTQQTNPVGQSGSIDYDPGHNVKQTIDHKGQVTQFQHDALNRLKLVTYADHSTIAYTYDQGNRVAQIADSANGTITRTYDGLNNITNEMTPEGNVSYAYYSDGRRKTMSVAGQPTLTYTYTARNHVEEISQAADAFNGNQARKVVFEYDAAGRRTKTTYFNGMVRENGFDKSGQLTSITYKSVSASVVGDLTYQYDVDGRIVEKGGSMAPSTRSTEMADATYDAAAKMSGVYGVTLTYDENGNLTSDASASYVWNTRDQLVEMRNLQGGVIAQFSYDALGRRRQKTIYGETSRYVYDQLDAVQEQGIDSRIKAVYVTGALDERLQRITPNGSTTRTDTYLTDHIGSILALKDLAGRDVVAYSYDSFGNSEASAVDGNPFQFTGRENDGTGLYYYRARYYSPTKHRFVQSDPIGLAGGINTYAYVENNPILDKDPLGLMGSRGNPNPGRSSFPYFPSRSEHVNRNANNACPRTKPSTDNQCPKWTQDTGALGGMNGGKFRSDRGDECAYDASGNLLPDENANYTYNYSPDPWTAQHIWQDVLPHFIYGGPTSYAPGLSRTY